VEFARGETKGTTILVADGGRRTAAEAVQRLLKEGQRVIAIDPFYFGESKIRSHDYLFALLISALGDRPLGIQASQLAAVARWSRAQGGPVTLMAIGRRCSTMALAAAALEEKAIDALELHQPLATLKQIIEENGSVASTPELFCFGLLEQCDIPQMHALVAPRPVRWEDASPRLKEELADLPKWYSALGGQFPGWE
jgi:hypothetical protein